MTNIGLILLDVDHFKKFNDTYGHQQGDEVLKSVARTMRVTVRQTDLVARYGGEEFVIILPKTDLKTLTDMAEKVRKSIETTSVLNINGGKELHVTASFGALHIDGGLIPDRGPVPDISGFVEAADKNLYAAKKHGRNRTILSSWEPARK